MAKTIEFQTIQDATDDQLWEWAEQQDILTIENIEKIDNIVIVTAAWDHQVTPKSRIQLVTDFQDYFEFD